MNNPTRQELEELIENDGIISFDPVCIRNKSNLSNNLNEYKFDDDNYNSSRLIADLPTVSPKLQILLDKIKELDDADYKKHGKLFKHVIYSELKNGIYGARLIASALIANKMNLGYSTNVKSSYKPIEPPSNHIDHMESKKKPKRYEPIQMLSVDTLMKTKNQNFYLLPSVSVYDQTLTKQHKKEILARFNSRPDNIQGELVRIMVLDSGFKEGIDLFDVKYIHIFEPTINESMQKQIIGRGTRICGQKGLDFHPVYGWKLHVFIYDLIIPKILQPSFMDVNSAAELYLKVMNIDMSKSKFANEVESITKFGAVDYELNKNIHLIKTTDTQSTHSGPFWELRNHINDHFREFEWDPIKLENLCKDDVNNNKKSGTLIKYNPTQNFVRHYFTPNNPCKGILLWHSVGTGKTCSAIATATTQFEKQDYTILWVTRSSLKNDIWKNMFNQVCNESIRNQIEHNDLQIPEEQSKRMKLLSKSWKIRPMSYKQFSNLVSKKNAFYEALVKKNGIADPLRKTLIIIDEAHKLYNNDDMSSLERPDMNLLYESIVKSYAVSGQDSVRLLLMTATPIVNCPFDIIKLLNLCKPTETRIPDNYEQFATQYLSGSGKFTEKGKRDYLNDISGYISYLNRTTDARQFAQPVITNIDVPMITDETDVKRFDKKIMNDLQQTTITDLQDKIIENNKLLELETADLDKNRFNFLKKDICNESSDIPKKLCDKVVNSNVKLLVNELKINTKIIRNNIKEIRTNLKDEMQTRIHTNAIIGKNKTEFKEEYNTYRKAPLHQIKQECSIKIDNNYNLQDKIKAYPPIIEIDNKLSEYKEQLDNINTIQQIQQTNNKDKIKQLQHMIKTQDLNSIEKSVMNMTIKSTRAEHSKQLRETRKRNASVIKGVQLQIQNVSKQRKTVYDNVRKTIKKRVHSEKQKAKAEIREVKQLRKELRKQSDYREDIQDDSVNSLINKYKINIKDDLEQLDKQIIEKEQERERIKQQKLEDKEVRRLAVEQRKYDKHVEREIARITKERERERARITKERERERARITKKRDKERERVAKSNENEHNKTQKKSIPKKKLLLRKTININR